MKSLRFRRFAAALILIVCCRLSAQKSDEPRQLYLKETTFRAFAYPNGNLDQPYTDLLVNYSRRQFPEASEILVESYITADKLRPVVLYYGKLCGQRFSQMGNHFTYIFSEIDGKPAARVEICPMEIGRIHREFWPTRVNLYLIRKPIVAGPDQQLNRSIDDLQKRIGNYCYTNGILHEDVARLEWQEYGADSEVFVIDTKDDFETVHLFFRRLYGAFFVRMAMDGDLFTRDFEIDISHALGAADMDKDLIVNVEENPIIIDKENNSQFYRGHVFIKYVFWKKSEEELKQMRMEQQGD